ncbi:MAG: TIGR00366 family protein [Oscillospiraceae bacterium]
MKEEKKGKKPALRAPNLLVLIFALILVASLLTYIVPAGQFNIGENGRVIAGTYHSVEQTPVSPWQAISMIFEGMNASGYIIFVIMLMGGCITAVLATGAVEQLISYAIYRLHKKNVLLLVPCCIVLMALLASFGGSDAFIAFIPVGIIFARRLRLDPIAAVAVFFMSSFVGFFSGPFIMSTQAMAGVPPFSGFVVRICVLIAIITFTCFYITRYCKRVISNPEHSLMGNTDWLQECFDEDAPQQEVKLDKRAVITLVLLIGSFAGLAIALPIFNLGYAELVGVLILVVIATGLLYGKSLSDIADGFSKGVMSMSGIAIIVGMARTISLVLDSGSILHTVIYVITQPLSYCGAGIAAILLFLSNAFINLFIPSCSGQAAVVIPLMLPVGEVLGITPQVVVSAFIYGDGLTNLCIPTFGVLVGALMMAKVPFGKWLKFVVPFVVICAVGLSALLFVLTSIGWTGL